MAHIRTLRKRLWMLEHQLIPQATKDQHVALEFFVAERAALRWVLSLGDDGAPA